jgi:hypothetical protein
MTSTHKCPSGCGRSVAQHQFSCPGCWYLLPRELRNAIWNSYRRGTAADHGAAMAAARDWYAQAHIILVAPSDAVGWYWVCKHQGCPHTGSGFPSSVLAASAARYHGLVSR